MAFTRAYSRRLSMILTVLVAPVCAAPVHAQSTLNDPVPVGDTQAMSSARTTALNGALNRHGEASRPLAAELARRKAHADQAAKCRQRAVAAYPAGSAQRRSLRAQCDAAFAAQKSTWYKSDQRKPEPNAARQDQLTPKQSEQLKRDLRPTYDRIANTQGPAAADRWVRAEVERRIGRR